MQLTNLHEFATRAVKHASIALQAAKRERDFRLQGRLQLFIEKMARRLAKGDIIMKVKLAKVIVGAGKPPVLMTHWGSLLARATPPMQKGQPMRLQQRRFFGRPPLPLLHASESWRSVLVIGQGRPVWRRMTRSHAAIRCQTANGDLQRILKNIKIVTQLVPSR